MIQIFNSRGLLRDDLHEIAATVPADKRPAFDALVEAVKLAEANEARVRDADAAVTEAARIHGAVMATAPKRTFMDEWRASIRH